MRKFLLRVIDLLNCGIIFGCWYSQAAVLLDGSWGGMFRAYGSLFGLAAAYLLLKQLLYIGRVRWFSNSFGLDRLIRCHKLNGYLVVITIAFHVIFIATGAVLTSDEPWLELLSSLIFKTDDLVAALVGLGILFFVALVTFFRKHLSYESWYFVHLFSYLAFPLVIEHQFELGFVVNSVPNFHFYWLGLYTFVVANFVLYRFVEPLLVSMWRGFYVERVEQETDDVCSVYIKWRGTKPYKFQAGQFVIVRFLAKGFWFEAHPFSISCAPGADFLRLTVKNVGDFSSRIKSVPPRAKVIIEGPHGTLTPALSKTGDILLIAGGIGITPLRSLAEQFLKERKHVALMYCHRFEKDGVFLQELDKLAAEGNLSIFHVISRGEVTIGEKGRISRERIRRLINNVAMRDCYVCGPGPMMDEAIKALRALDVPRSRIHSEHFSF